jgi:hypothetical protein
MSAPRFQELARGIALIAMFRREGFRLLTGSANEIVASLIPLLFLLIASGLVQTLDRPDASKAAALLAALSTVLLPVVLSEALARLWRREAQWGRYIVAFNWCQWALTFFGAASLVAADLLGLVGIPQAVAVMAALAAFVVYQIALFWFMARRGLDLSRWRATLLVSIVEIATSGALVLFIMLDASGTGSDG